MTNIKENIKVLKKIKKKSNNFIITDIIKSYFKYNCSLKEYDDFDFHTLNEVQKATYLTEKINKKIIENNNNMSYLHLLKNFNEFFACFTNLIDLQKSELDLILKNKGNIIDKNINFKQNKKINELEKNNVSILEITTFYNNEKAYILNSILNIGNKNIIAFLNENGTVSAPAIDSDNNIIGIHPESKKQILGFNMPLYKEATEKALIASKKLKEIKYVTWYFIIGEEKVHLISATATPKIRQLKPKFSKNKIGVLEKYKNIINFNI